MEWINVVLTVVSLVGGGFAWWQAHGSRNARRSAEVAERNAKRQADGVDAIAESMRLPDMGFEFRGWPNGDESVLETVFVNRTGAPVHVEEIHHDQPRDFFTDTFRRGASVDLAVPVRIHRTWGGEIPAQIELTVGTQRRTFRVPHGPSSSA